MIDFLKNIVLFIKILIGFAILFILRYFCTHEFMIRFFALALYYRYGVPLNKFSIFDPSTYSITREDLECRIEGVDKKHTIRMTISAMRDLENALYVRELLENPFSTN